MSQGMEQGRRDQYLTFELAGSEYGIGILGVKEILQYETITPVPSVPRSVRGVINLRGSVVPVVDLAIRFGLTETAVTGKTCILIAEVRQEGRPTVMGLMVDAVCAVIELGAQDIEPPPAFGTRVRVDYLLGAGKVGDKRLVLLLDVERVISTDERDAAGRIGGTPAVDPAGLRGEARAP